MDMNNSWKDYWNKENPEFDEIMCVTTKVFYENLCKRFPLKNSDVLLDYGCGPGVLIQLLKEDCKKIIGVDSSPVYIEKCKDLFEKEPNVSILKIDDFSELKELVKAENVNIVVVLSVIQYFSSSMQLTEFLDIFRITSKEAGKEIRVLVADIIPVRHIMVLDFFEILYDALRRKYLTKYFKFIVKYLKEIIINKRAKKLQVDYLFFERYADNHGIAIYKINGLTNHKNRYSVEIIFSP